MKRLLSKWLFAVFSLWLGIAVASAATFTNPVSGFAYTFPVLTVTNGDTVVWTGLSPIHSVTPKAGVTEPFCGTGTAQPSCTVTFNTLGSFGYRCINHGVSFNMTGQVIVVAAPNQPPTATITNLVNEQIIISPEPLSIFATVNDPDGSIALVRLITNGVAVATNTTPPFGNFVLSNPPGVRFFLRVNAVDNQGASANSAQIALRPAPRPVLAFQPGSNGPLQFQFNSVSGISYIVEQSLALTNFTPVATLSNNGGVLQFSETNGSSTQKFIRVRLQ